ncbi:MAG TPA: 3-dehydroquinate synthase [Pseudomonadales bacterium]|nr:3-dehydroquinate synthase [Pseudomonadales bacterium]
MRTLNVELGARSYPVYVGAGLLSNSGMLDRHVRASQILVITNETVAPLYLDKVFKLFSGYRCGYEILPDGERYKNQKNLDRIYDKLIRDNYSRTATLVALGGGVIGDMTGFAASCYQRGVSFIQLPTTLLAQVDSSVGGKTGINHPLGKNMIGAFHQPSCVLIDTNTLLTLPAREFAAGLAEIIKYGLINNRQFFFWLEKNITLLLDRNSDALIYAIETSCRDKAAIVAADETETGVRALLNLGHTFGHAIESWQEYSGFLHGEAVSVGIVVAAELSFLCGSLTAFDVSRIRNLLMLCGLPTSVPTGMTNQDFMGLMQRDKKVMDGCLRLILLNAIGDAVIRSDVFSDLVFSAIDRCRLD